MREDQTYVADFQPMKRAAVLIVLRLFKYFADWNPILAL
tara:strand:- start:417 stop:533 length:117 start_codon:yes stop_codon:yes gene_type:complete